MDAGDRRLHYVLTGVLDMQRLVLPLVVFLCSAATGWSQVPPMNPPPAKEGDNERLDLILKIWHQRMLSMETFYTQCTRTDKHPVTKKVSTFEGEAMFMRPNLAKIELTNKADKEDFERYFWKEKYIFNYQPKDKVILVHEIPQTQQNTDNMILSFLKGITPAEARKRFNITLQKETEWHAYLLIQPRDPADQQDFELGQLAIWLKNPNPPNQPDLRLMPARFWYREPNKKEVTFLFNNTVPNANLKKDVFTPTSIKGWEVKYANQQPVVQPMPPTPKNPLTPIPKTIDPSLRPKN